jgi:chromosome segregation ATPase
MEGVNSFVAWSALVLGLAQVVPVVLSLRNRRRSEEALQRSSDAKTDVDRFKATLEAYDGLLNDCREQGRHLQADLDELREDLRTAKDRIAELKGLLERLGWQDARHAPRPPA